jgi:hypothetical protein
LDAETLTMLAKILEVGGMPGLSVAVVILAMKLYFGGPRGRTPEPDPTATALESVAAEMRNLRLELVQHRTEADTRLSEHDRRLGAIENRINSR